VHTARLKILRVRHMSKGHMLSQKAASPKNTNAEAALLAAGVPVDTAPQPSGMHESEQLSQVAKPSPGRLETVEAMRTPRESKLAFASDLVEYKLAPMVGKIPHDLLL